ncbi:MAG TPA: glycosyltransferase family A protein [Anaerolineae bacterium]|nr:glycosyltransferase family A protein [Anaerolineae bacterium]
MPKPTTALISVIIPVYNAARFLADAVASIRAQQYAPLEIIIVDDGSTDGTAATARSLGEDIRYLYQPNAGPAAARNRGLELARGEIIAFQDADDIWSDHKLATQLALLDRYPAAGVVLGFTRLVETIEGEQKIGRPGLVTVLQAALFRRTVFDQVGWLDEQLRLGEDIDWYLRALEQGAEIISHQEAVLFYRRHAANLTHNLQEAKVHFLRALGRSLSRRRQATGQASALPADLSVVLSKLGTKSHGQ